MEAEARERLYQVSVTHIGGTISVSSPSLGTAASGGQNRRDMAVTAIAG